MYDAIIIGARPAGSTTARLLANKGYKVLLVDKAKFPSDSLSTHFIWQKGVYYLKKWNLYEKIIDSNCPSLKKMVSDYKDFPLVGCPLPYQDNFEMLGPRRIVLDKILLDAALDAGVTFLDEFSIRELLFDGGQVVGVQGYDKDDKLHDIKGKIIIGADGRNTLVAQKVNAKKYKEVPGKTFTYFTYFSNMPLEAIEFYHYDNYVIYTFPTNDDRSLLGIFGKIENVQNFKKNYSDHFFKTLKTIPNIEARLLKAKQEEKIYGCIDLPNFFRKSYGPGWALVGDAGYCKDPGLGQGITDCFRDAELLSEAIDIGFHQENNMLKSLSNYEKKRDEIVEEIYEFTLQSASITPTGKILQLRNSIKNNAEYINRFLGLTAGTQSSREFFSKDHLKVILETNY